MKDILLISFGAVFGVNTRFIIYKKLEKLYFKKEFLILVINSFSSFCLGLFFSLLSKISSMNLYDQLVLFFSIGFFGSLSTFSTFIYDLYELFFKIRFLSALNLFFLSLTFGTLSLFLGFWLGNQ